jgi:hypothetical protein
MSSDQDLKDKLELLPPDVRTSIEKMAPNLQETCIRMYLRTIEHEACKCAGEIRGDIIPGGAPPLQQMWAPCAPMPSDMCRVSPFFPMSKNEMKVREYVRDVIITKSSWGEIRYTGPRLSIYEEDVLLAVLSLIDEGAPSSHYRGALLPVLKRMGYQKAGGSDYKKVLDALKLLIANNIELIVSRQKGKKPKRIFNTNIISAGGWDDEKQELFIAVNPHFIELYAKSGITHLDVDQRIRLRSPIARSLFRFVMSQNSLQPMHFLTLGAALNLNMELPPRKIRDRIKRAIGELIKIEILSDDSGFHGRDIVKMNRTPQSKVKRKLIDENGG